MKYIAHTEIPIEKNLKHYYDERTGQSLADKEDLVSVDMHFTADGEPNYAVCHLANGKRETVKVSLDIF